MEEPQSGQEPGLGRHRDGTPEPAHLSVAASDAAMSERERQLIREGQAKAERDLAEMQARGFGHHIGSE